MAYFWQNGPKTRNKKHEISLFFTFFHFFLFFIFLKKYFWKKWKTFALFLKKLTRGLLSPKMRVFGVGATADPKTSDLSNIMDSEMGSLLDPKVAKSPFWRGGDLSPFRRPPTFAHFCKTCFWTLHRAKKCSFFD